MYTYRLKHQGFTIVELLVVIVVIAILTTIGVSGYSNLQLRAANTSRVAEIVAWKKAFMIYRNLRGEWPPSVVIDEEYCLGSGYPMERVGCHAVITINHRVQQAAQTMLCVNPIMRRLWQSCGREPFDMYYRSRVKVGVDVPPAKRYT